MNKARPSLGTLIGRGLRRRCPRCGSKRIFSSWFKMVDSCPRCGLAFSREEGYWVGAIIMNTAVTEAVFGIILVAVLVATAPDVPVVPLIAAGVATNGILPVLFYPFSKTLWMAVDVHFHPLDETPG